MKHVGSESLTDLHFGEASELSASSCERIQDHQNLTKFFDLACCLGGVTIDVLSAYFRIEHVRVRADLLLFHDHA
jgi:hypothetical protein